MNIHLFARSSMVYRSLKTAHCYAGVFRCQELPVPHSHGFIFKAIPLLSSIIASHLYFSKQLLKNGLGARLLNSVLFLSSWAFALHLALQCILDRERENVAGLVSRPLGAQLPTAPSCAQLWSAAQVSPTACPALPWTTGTLLLLSKPHTHPINSLCSEASFKWGNEPSVI